MQNPLADALHWRRADFGPAVGDVLAAIAARRPRRAGPAGRGAATPTPLLARDRASSRARTTEAARGALPWPNGAATAPARQILADLGLGKLRVLGTPRRQVGLAGFGLEVVEYVDCRTDALARAPRQSCGARRALRLALDCPPIHGSPP